MTSSLMLVCAMAFVLVIGSTSTSFADAFLPPLKQLQDGVAIEDIVCRDERVLVLRDNGSPACVTERTAERTGWSLIEKVFESKSDPDQNVATQPNNVEIDKTSQILEFSVSSGVEFEDDGREYPNVLQRSPGPLPIYDKIMSFDFIFNERGLDSPESMSVLSVPHEKYSVNYGEGLYIEDWMPSYIIPGYKLLYAHTQYNDYRENRIPHEVHTALFYYVPYDYILLSNATDFDLYNRSDGYRVSISIDTKKFDEPEDAIERLREIFESQSGNYGGFREMTYNGKTVSAYEGGNDLNPYSSHVAFTPDEYTAVRVNSYYHTLDELIPVFESIME